MSATGVGVVVPVFGNADTLAELHLRVAAVLGDACAEIVFVDDACPAGSGEVLAALARSDRRVKVVSLARNGGQHRAVLAGLAAAHADWSVVLDADLQDPPEAIPALLAAARHRGAAAVFAGRRGRYESRGRLATSRLLKRSLSLVCGAPRDAGLFVALDRRVRERVLAQDARRPFVVAMVACSGLPVASVPVARAARPSGRSAYGSRARLRSGARALGWALAWRLRGGGRAVLAGEAR